MQLSFPLVVDALVEPLRALSMPAIARRARVLIITLDPWRDTPSRLGAIATTWNLAEGTHVLWGPRTWWNGPSIAGACRAPATRTGDILHPSIVYVVAADGRIAYAVTGGAETIAAAVRAL